MSATEAAVATAAAAAAVRHQSRQRGVESSCGSDNITVKVVVWQHETAAVVPVVVVVVEIVVEQ